MLLIFALLTVPHRNIRQYSSQNTIVMQMVVMVVCASIVLSFVRLRMASKTIVYPTCTIACACSFSLVMKQCKPTGQL